MAKPDQLPEYNIIDGMKGIVDYYYWKGIAVARRWPRYFARKPTAAEAINQTDFAYINKLYSTLPPIIIEALQEHATGTTQISKDYLVRAYLKGLFTLMPPDYYATEETLEAVRVILAAITDYATQTTLAALLTELALKADLTETQPISAAALPLPAGAATQATLADALTALQIIDGFADAQNTIWAYYDRYTQTLSHTKVGAATYDMDFDPVPAGEVWVIENISARDAGTIVRIYLRGRTNAGVLVNLKGETPAVASDWIIWGGRLVLMYQDHLRISFIAAQDGDILTGNVWGYKMKV